jgi:hypothetical protein
METGRIRRAADLERMREQGERSLYPETPKVSVGMATCGLATGALEVYESFLREVEAAGTDVVVARTGCIGFCQMEPIVALKSPRKTAVLLKKMTPK